MTKAGIAYRHEKQLGSPRTIRHRLRKTAIIRAFSASSIGTDRTVDVVETLTEELKGNVALMCYEKNHEECHRRSVADALAELLARNRSIWEWMTRQGKHQKRRVRILVKAFPQPSAKHEETVCCAGVERRQGTSRLYPIRYRRLPKGDQFDRYDLVEMTTTKATLGRATRELSCRRRFDQINPDRGGISKEPKSSSGGPSSRHHWGPARRQQNRRRSSVIQPTPNIHQVHRQEAMDSSRGPGGRQSGFVRTKIPARNTV